MKSFQQFITEAYDKELEGQASRKPGEGGRIRASRKKDRADMPSRLSKGNAKARVKAVGGGKTAPAKTYKDRKDIGTNKPRSKVEQQPQKERGSAALSAKDAQKKAYLERKRREKGEKTPTRTQLLTKKTKTVDPKYKSQKATVYTAPERQKITRAGERLVRDIQKKKEKPASHYDPKVKK